MNVLILASLLCLVCGSLSALGSTVTFSAGLSAVSGATASAEGLQSTLGEDEELEVEEDLSGADTEDSPPVLRFSAVEKKSKRRGKGKRKNRQKNKSTTALLPNNTSGHTLGITSAGTTTQDPCTSSHLGYCIHGQCKYMEDLKEPVCVCMKGFDGVRCGIQLLGSKNQEDEAGSNAEMVQTVLVVIAVVLSIISCTAILLMTCAHYRTHKNFLAAYLGSSSEKEKLQAPPGGIMV